MILGWVPHFRHLTSIIVLAERGFALQLKSIIIGAPSEAGALERLSVTDDLPVIPRGDGWTLPARMWPLFAGWLVPRRPYFVPGFSNSCLLRARHIDPEKFGFVEIWGRHIEDHPKRRGRACRRGAYLLSQG